VYARAHINSQGKKRREKILVLSLFLKVDREGAEVKLGGRCCYDGSGKSLTSASGLYGAASSGVDAPG